MSTSLFHGFDRRGQRCLLSAGRQGFAPVEVDFSRIWRHEYARGWNIAQVIVKVLAMLSGLAHQDRLCEACAARATN